MVEMLRGDAVARELDARMRDEVARLWCEAGIVPALAVILVGQDPASEIYVRRKRQAARHSAC